LKLSENSDYNCLSGKELANSLPDKLKSMEYILMFLVPFCQSHFANYFEKFYAQFRITFRLYRSQARHQGVFAARIRALRSIASVESATRVTKMRVEAGVGIITANDPAVAEADGL
jgi:hypothetical protein